MASYGVFTAITGYAHHGPKGHLGFAPKLRPEDFKAAFTTAQGWGSFSQRIVEKKIDVQIALRWGQLVLQTLSLELPRDFKVTQIDGAPGKVQFAIGGNLLTITFPQKIKLSAGQNLELTIH
jgi:non-lysosomal glucosylceramidase